jgi:tetratricopeptide (TPR) repeat protein
VKSSARTPSNHFAASRVATFLDLRPAGKSPLYVYRVENDAEDMVKGLNGRHNVQRLMPRSFRQVIADDCCFPQYAVDDPRDLPDDLRTDRWRQMCHQVTNYHDLQPTSQVNVAKLLLSLGFHEFVRQLVRQPNAHAVQNDDNVANLARIRAVAGFALSMDADSEPDLSEFEFVAEHAPRGSLHKLWANLNLVVAAAKELRRLDLTERYCDQVEATLSAFSAPDEFDYSLVRSRIHRATAFRPFLQKRIPETISEMDLAERFARRAMDLAATERENLLARENLMTALESRSKEAIAFGELALAEDRTRQMVDLDRLDPKNHLELGDILSRRGKFAEALDAYRWAARLGPPATATAWFMAGQCLEQLNAATDAADCYLHALNCDPLSISAAERLGAVAGAADWQIVAEWSQRYAGELSQ